MEVAPPGIWFPPGIWYPPVVSQRVWFEVLKLPVLELEPLMVSLRCAREPRTRRRRDRWVGRAQSR